MELYSKMLDFPKKVHPELFTLSVTILYGIFCIDPTSLFDNKSYDYHLFYNDFNESGYLAWFIASLYQNTFALIAYRAACSYIAHRLIKSIFYALMFDALINIINVIIFGCYNPIEAIIIRNVFVILAVLYAYFVLPHDKY